MNVLYIDAVCVTYDDSSSNAIMLFPLMVDVVAIRYLSLIHI